MNTTWTLDCGCKARLTVDTDRYNRSQNTLDVTVRTYLPREESSSAVKGSFFMTIYPIKSCRDHYTPYQEVPISLIDEVRGKLYNLHLTAKEALELITVINTHVR